MQRWFWFWLLVARQRCETVPFAAQEDVETLRRALSIAQQGCFGTVDSEMSLERINATVGMSFSKAKCNGDCVHRVEMAYGVVLELTLPGGVYDVDRARELVDERRARLEARPFTTGGCASATDYKCLSKHLAQYLTIVAKGPMEFRKDNLPEKYSVAWETTKYEDKSASSSYSCAQQNSSWKVIVPTVPSSGQTFLRTLFEQQSGLLTLSYAGSRFHETRGAYDEDEDGVCGSIGELEARDLRRSECVTTDVKLPTPNETFVLKSHTPFIAARPNSIEKDFFESCLSVKEQQQLFVLRTVRNPLDNYLSWRQRWMTPSNEMTLPQFFVRWATHHLFWDQIKVPQALVRYEDFSKENLENLFDDLIPGTHRRPRDDPERWRRVLRAYLRRGNHRLEEGDDDHFYYFGGKKTESLPIKGKCSSFALEEEEALQMREALSAYGHVAERYGYDILWWNSSSDGDYSPRRQLCRPTRPLVVETRKQML